MSYNNGSQITTDSIMVVQPTRERSDLSAGKNNIVCDDAAW